MQLAFHTLDVFTTERLAGNGLAVVFGADDLDRERMQAIAREFNQSETVFVQKPSNPAHTAKVRIFTPASELPFAGHPTVGTAILLAGLNGGEGAGKDAIIALEENIGTVRVGVRFRAGEAPFAEFDAPKLSVETGPPLPPVEALAAAVGLLPREIGFANHRPTRFSAGSSFAFIPVSSLEAMAKAHVNSQHWERAAANQDLVGAFLYARETVHTTSSFHARMFAPSMGIVEDPATGSAAAAFAGVIQRFDTLPDGTHKRVIEQGLEMGRPSFIFLSLEIEGGKLQAVRIGGHAVTVCEGRISI